VTVVDTSVWVDHLRHGVGALVSLLARNEVLVHPFVIGELALGGPHQREALAELLELPVPVVASDQEVLLLVEQETLHGIGIGYIDCHLLAATRLTPGARLWTLDGRLRAAAERLLLAARSFH